MTTDFVVYRISLLKFYYLKYYESTLISRNSNGVLTFRYTVKRRKILLFFLPFNACPHPGYSLCIAFMPIVALFTFT